MRQTTCLCLPPTGESRLSREFIYTVNMKHGVNLARIYPPSAPCSCEICRAYCARPGWWTVQEASRAFAAGHGARMMLELSLDRAFGVLAPAFKGCENSFALDKFKDNGCTFYNAGGCELHGSGLQPLECRFCHHDRPGQGLLCHVDIGKDWARAQGRLLVGRWCRRNRLWNSLELLGLQKLKKS